MTNLESWLNDMSSRPLPGGVAAAAIAAAMGAALIAKALRLTLGRLELEADERQVLAAVLSLVRQEQTALQGYAQADVNAYQAVIDTRSLPTADPARQQAWGAATEVPLAVAEGCSRLVNEVQAVVCQCWPSVCVDYAIGSELLKAGARAGRLAAEANLAHWGEPQQAESFRARLEALGGQEQAGRET